MSSASEMRMAKLVFSMRKILQQKVVFRNLLFEILCALALCQKIYRVSSITGLLMDRLAIREEAWYQALPPEDQGDRCDEYQIGFVPVRRYDLCQLFQSPFLSEVHRRSLPIDHLELDAIRY